MRDVLVVDRSIPPVPLPSARGDWSALVLARMGAGRSGSDPPAPVADPLGDEDLQLALTLCYELHYRGLPGVDDDAEWDPAILEVRRELESAFVDALTAAVRPAAETSGDVRATLRAIAGASTDSPFASFLEREASFAQLREFLIHRSAYQLKEADPHSWAIPRLEGDAKSALMEIQYDEYGSGDPAWLHAELFRRTMTGVGLDGRHGAYLDRIPGPTLATLNLVSLFGLHRRWRGALVGHLALFEMTSTLPNRSYANGFRRLGMGQDVTRFFDEHVEADSVHEVLAEDLAALVATGEPSLAADVVFGARALDLLEGRFASTLLRAWRAGRSSLRPPAGR